MNVLWVYMPFKTIRSLSAVLCRPRNDFLCVAP